MSFFKRLFGAGNEGAQVENNSSISQTIKKFGRYTDINKNKEQISYWNSSLEKFKNKDYVGSFEDFFIYLNDKNVQNVTSSREGDRVNFEIIQGSKVIRGFGDANDIFAEASIAIMEKTSTPVMRKLMALNYNLKYSKFAIKDDHLKIKFSSHSIDASPHKLYDALKELSKKADQQDDLLVAEFSALKEIDTDQIIDLPADVKEAKYHYLIKWINEIKEEIDKLDQSKFSGGIAFLLLSLTYKIDYLICPQGKLTDILEKIQHMFFAKNNLTTPERNKQIIEEFDQVLAMSKEDIMEGLYYVKCTFAIANPSSHKNLMNMINDERGKVKWYRDNNYKKVEEAVYEYMISYAFFNYGMPYPITDVLNLCMLILNQDYYSNFGDSRKLIEGENLNKKEILKDVNNIITSARKDYPNANINNNMLNFSSKTAFLDSLLVEMGNLDLRKS